MKEIIIIVYSSKAHIKEWFLDVFFGGPGTEMLPPYRSFNIRVKNSKKIIRLWMKREEFDRIKDCLQCKVQIL